MTKDFKTPTSTGSESSFGQYGMSWMLGGIAIGLLAGLAMYALASKNEQPAANTPVPATAASNTQYAASTLPAGQQQGETMTDTVSATMRDAPVEEETDEAPGFSYHAVLPQLEVGIPITVQEEQAVQAKAEAKKAAKKEEKKTDTAAPSLSKANGFQLGSYKTQAQATALQNRLKKNGLNTRVEQGSVNGQTWYRVRLGPATSQEMLNKWQQTLSGMGISPMAVRM